MSKSIRGLLAFAATSSLVLAQGETKPANGQTGGGWSAKPGAGLKFDGGDAFGLELRNRLQVHWTYANNENAEDTNTFDVRRARTTLSGHVFQKNILYYLQLELNDTDGALKQGWSQWNFSSSETSTIGLKVGQAKTMFGLEGTGTSAGLWFVERSIAARAFSDAYSQGAWLNGKMAEERLRWAFGAMNTDVANGLSQNLDTGESTPNNDAELSYVLSANFDPLGDFFGGKQTAESWRQGDWRTDDNSLKGTIGAGIALGNGVDAVAGSDIESTSFNINTAWNVSRINLLGELFVRSDDAQAPVTDQEDSLGIAIGGGYLLEKSGDSAIQWGLGFRVSMIETDAGDNAAVNYIDVLGAAEGSLTEVSAVVNAFYHGHPCKTQFEYTFQDADPDGALAGVTNHILRIAFQVEF